MNWDCVLRTAISDIEVGNAIPWLSWVRYSVYNVIYQKNSIRNAIACSGGLY